MCVQAFALGLLRVVAGHEVGFTSTIVGSGESTGGEDGVGTSATLTQALGVVAAPNGETLYVTEYSNKIRKVDIATRNMTTLAGRGGSHTDGIGTSAVFQGLHSSVAVSPDGKTLYVPDHYGRRLRAVDVATRQVTTLAGDGSGSGHGSGNYRDGTGTGAQIPSAISVAITPDGASVYLGEHHRIRLYDVSTARVTTVAGQGSNPYGNGVNGNQDGVGTSASFGTPYGMTISHDGGTLLIADTPNHRIRAMEIATSRVKTLAGWSQGYADGTGTEASFKSPYDIAAAPDGVSLFVADFGNNYIRKIVLATASTIDGDLATVSTIFGSGEATFADGPKDVVSLAAPRSLSVRLLSGVYLALTLTLTLALALALALTLPLTLTLTQVVPSGCSLVYSCTTPPCSRLT